MRYLVFGDVHGNLDALEAVLQDAQPRGVDGYFFVGDVVGYGPCPMECIDRLFAMKQRGLLAWVAGNHELAVRDEVDLSNYTHEAVTTLKWTRGLLEAQPWALNFVKEAEVLTHVNEQIVLTHDSIVEPSSGVYHRWPQNAIHELYTLTDRGGRIAFYGHTHTQRAEFFDNHNILLVPVEAHVGAGNDPHPLRLKEEQAAWIGAGSVGFPTNKARQPEYLIFDDLHWLVEKYAVNYDRDKAKTRTRQTLTPPCGEAVAERIAHWL